MVVLTCTQVMGMASIDQGNVHIIKGFAVPYLQLKKLVWLVMLYCLLPYLYDGDGTLPHHSNEGNYPFITPG